MYSKAPVDEISLACSLLPYAIENSSQWKRERALGEATTDCITIMIPESPGQDISITIWVGRKQGLDLNERLNFERTWESPRAEGEFQR